MLLLAGCAEKSFTAPMELGGETVSAEVLNEGRERYMQNCYACHGNEGDGKGPAAVWLRPPPRNFKDGVFKFGGVRAGELPHTEDLVHLVRQGLTGTAMLPWDVTESQMTSIIHYIKTLSPRWQKEKMGERITPTEDPWKGKETEAVAAGEKIYHAKALCKGCHPTYITKQQLADLTKAELGYELTEVSDSVYRPELKSSQYGIQILPIDFLYHPIKTISEKLTDAEKMQRLYTTIAAGVGGTAMPPWKGALEEADLWALVYYVKSLADLRNTPKAGEMRLALLSQPPFAPPAANTPAPTP